MAAIETNAAELIPALQDGVTLVDFFAPWCEPCQKFMPTLNELATQYEGRVRVVKVDVEKNAQLAQQFNVRSLPTVVLMKAGKREYLWSRVPSAEEVQKKINAALEG